MLIKELEGVLVLVENMPREWQIKCVKLLFWQVENWEQRQSEPELTDDEWYALQEQRRALKIGDFEHALARLERALISTESVDDLLQPVRCAGIVESYDSDDGRGVMISGRCRRQNSPLPEVSFERIPAIAMLAPLLL